MSVQTSYTANVREKAILVCSYTGDMYTPEEAMEELEQLVQSAGLVVVAKVLQHRKSIDPNYYTGKGKLEEIALLRQKTQADVVVFDGELSARQIRNLEDVLECKIIDRTMLILDIFARRARSAEGKIQVELAQLKYRLSRLAGLGRVLSRTGGGIGTRGPGEKKLETDRRHIRRRIKHLERELVKVARAREMRRKRRVADGVHVASVVGYTNAGKSTLRNRLCEIAGIKKDRVFESDMLFATLDPTIRLIRLPSGRKLLVSDTVGFIRNLPHELVEAFKSTLEEVTCSDFLIHVVDASCKNAFLQIEVVNNVLREIGAGNKKTILVLNKTDVVEAQQLQILKNIYPEGLEISARLGTNIDTLFEEMDHICAEIENTV